VEHLEQIHATYRKTDTYSNSDTKNDKRNLSNQEIMSRIWEPVAHTYNPAYTGSRNQEDHSSKPARANSRTLTQEKNITQKKGLSEWLMCYSTCLASMKP
jgi:hypothetical protein